MNANISSHLEDPGRTDDNDHGRTDRNEDSDENSSIYSDCSSTAISARQIQGNDDSLEPSWDHDLVVITGYVVWWDKGLGKGQVIEQPSSEMSALSTINWMDIAPLYGALVSPSMVQYQVSDSGRFINFWVMRGHNYVL